MCSSAQLFIEADSEKLKLMTSSTICLGSGKEPISEKNIYSHLLVPLQFADWGIERRRAKLQEVSYSENNRIVG